MNNSHKPFNESTFNYKPFFIPPGEPLQPAAGGGINVRFLVRSSQTNNQFSSVEAALGPKKMGASPHLHKDLDEVMFVLEGAVHIMVGETVYEVPAGGWHMRPRGILHSYWNSSDHPARFIEIYPTQNFDDYLEEVFFNIIPYMVKNNLTGKDPVIAKRRAELDHKFGIIWFPEKRQSIIDKYGLKV